MTREQTKEENVKNAIEVIKSFGTEGITVKDVAELVNVSPQTIYNMQANLELNGIECRPEKTGRRFIYKPMVKEIFRNAEGYTDKTAGEAIAGKKAVNDFKVGGIYEGKYLILKVFSDTLVYLQVLSYREKNEFCNDICVRFDINGEEQFVNPHRVWSILRSKVDMNDLYVIDMSLYRQIAGLAGMSVTEVEKNVEKVVIQEKIVEVPVKDFEYKLLEQRAELWEKAFYAVTGASK